MKIHASFLQKKAAFFLTPCVRIGVIGNYGLCAVTIMRWFMKP